MKSKRTLITIVCIVGILLICCVGGCNTYNKMVGLEEGVDQSWSEVETQYQRRADLIPNLVNTVKGYATHESQTFEKVTEARAKATSITLNVDDLTEENLAKFQQAQNDLSSALKSLLAVSENYPDLKASKNFEDLQRPHTIYGTSKTIQHFNSTFSRQYLCRNVWILFQAPVQG